LPERVDVHLKYCVPVKCPVSYNSVSRPAMSSRVETARIKAELHELESALNNITDSRIREIVEIRIAELRTKLRRFQNLLRSA